MSYKTYITDALVCGSRVQNTADRSYLLFTREAGILYATAKSVREERSTQRFALQEFSLLRASLVYGKSGWRVAGAEPIQDLYATQTTREGRTLIRNIVRLLRRLLHGETPHASLFDEVVEMLTAEDEGNAPMREEVMTIRILHALGYIAPVLAVRSILETKSVVECARTLDPALTQERRELIREALHESQL